MFRDNQPIFLGWYGSLRIDDAIECIEETLLLKHSDVVALRKNGSKRIDVGLKTGSFCYRSVQECLGISVRLSSGQVVSVDTPNNLNRLTDVYVKGAPLEWAVKRYSRIFGWYGEVKNTFFLNVKQEDTKKNDYMQKESGVVKIKMRVKKAIPSSLTVDGERVEVYYKDQERTCWV